VRDTPTPAVAPLILLSDDGKKLVLSTSLFAFLFRLKKSKINKLQIVLNNVVKYEVFPENWPVEWFIWDQGRF